MEEQCIQMAVTLFERYASKHPVSVENDDRISSIFIVPLADLYICCRWEYYLGVGIHLAGNRCRSIRLDGSKAKGTGKIMIGIEKIAGGEVEYQIPVNGLLAEQKEIAEKVNLLEKDWKQHLQRV